MPITATARNTSTITANTFQPLPRTNSRLRPNAANTPGRSRTVTGATTDHMTSRIKPRDDQEHETDRQRKAEQDRYGNQRPNTGSTLRIRSPIE